MLGSYQIKNIVLALTAAFSLSACNLSVDVKTKKAEKKQIDPKKLISCEGVGEVKFTDSRESLVKKFGEKNVVDHENTIYGVFTSVYEGGPRHVNIFWNEKRPPFQTIKYIEVSEPGSEYMTKDSVQLGQTLRELVKRNGSISIRFRSIYNKESPGLISSFNGGEIEKNTPCFAGVLEQARIKTVHSDEIKAFREKVEVDSYDPMLNRIEYELVSIRISNKQ